MLSYIYLNVDECWFKLNISLHNANIEQNAFSFYNIQHLVGIWYCQLRIHYYVIYLLNLVARVVPSIHPFPMLVATGSFSPERGLPVKFCVAFNHFKSIIMSALLHSKTLLPTKFNLLKSSL